MLNVYINRNPNYGPYGGGAKFVNAFYQYAKQNGFNIVEANEASNLADIFFCMSIDGDENNYNIQQLQNIRTQAKSLDFVCGRGKDIPLVLRVNECDARKNTFDIDNKWFHSSHNINSTIWVSDWLKTYFWSKTGWLCLDTQNVLKNIIIKNGVDRKCFKPNTKFQNGKTNIVMAHWSSHPMKGEDYLVWLDDFVKRHNDFTFTYIGRKNVCLHNTRYVAPLPAKELGAELGKYDVCINASRFDPGPNSVIEPITCGLPTYVHVDGGGGREFAGEDHVFATFDDLNHILLQKQFITNNVKFDNWDIVMKRVFDHLKDVYYVNKNT